MIRSFSSHALRTVVAAATGFLFLGGALDAQHAAPAPSAPLADPWGGSEWLRDALAMNEDKPAAAPEKPPVKESAKPWRLDDVLHENGFPEWLSISGSLRVRWEGIEGQFRAANRLDDQDNVIVSRLLVRARADFDPLILTIEGQDSRQYHGDRGSALGTSTVNTVEVLEANIGLRLGEMAGGTHQVKAGRITFNLGSRRLVARNRYRNTINAFTGVHWEWKDDQQKLTAFWTFPVRRRPTRIGRLVDNDIYTDEEDADVNFFGVHYEVQDNEGYVVEVYGFGLLEDQRGSRRRNLGTFGGRLMKKKKVGHFDWQAESAIQLGRSAIGGGGPRFDHFANFMHLSAGYTFDCAWTPRVRLAFDYASGDEDSTDRDNNRFDTLFGARRFEYGPTGIYGAIARNNLLSPDLRVEFKPAKKVACFVATRAFWLASDEDAFVAAGVIDRTGNSGQFVGQQVETRVRWDVVKNSVRIETGVAYLFDGDFQREAPGGQGTDTLYGYLQCAFTF